MPTVILLKKLLLPPTSLVLLALAALGALQWEVLPAGQAKILLWIAVGGLYFFGLSSVGFALLRSLEQFPPYDPTSAGGHAEPGAPGAIVVLDAGRYARGRGPDAVKPETLDRLQHGVWQQRASGLPILVSGDGAGPLMDTVLRQLFGLEARWIEPTSRNTQENADHSAAILRAEGIDHVVLVTHGWHMPRAVAAFERAGLSVTPAPMGFSGPDRWELRLLSLVPTATGWLATHTALHEWVGLLWYRLRYGSRGSSGRGSSGRGSSGRGSFGSKAAGPSSIGPPNSSSTNTVA